MEEYRVLIEKIYKDADPIVLEQAIGFTKIVFICIFSIIGLILVVSLWKIFKKSDEKPWKAVIPIYNYITLYKISGISPIFLLVFFLMFIPKISLIGYILWNIVDATQKAMLVRRFGKSIWFIVGIIIFDFIFYPILAFGSSNYNKRNVLKNENS